MKTMPILIAMLMAGSAVAWDASDEAFARSGMCKLDNCKGGGATSLGTVDIPDRGTTGGPKLSSGTEYITKPVDPNLAGAASSSKVDYSIITLADGKTASVLTFK
ncbi:MAG: hypothetical protein WAL87_03760 [Chthoniobacterales bacterium]